MREAVTVYTLMDAIKELRSEVSDLRDMAHDMRQAINIMRAQIIDISNDINSIGEVSE